MKITFLGAAETVTGSKYLLEFEKKKILIDCGLFQGHKEMRERNWEDFFIDPRDIDALILTHAHIDHSGYIPLLIKKGFCGKIFCSPATFDLCKILLLDSGFLQEEDAMRANKYGYTKHKPALPLYTKDDAEFSLQFFQSVNFDEIFHFDENINFTLNRAGHILGASFITLTYNGESIVFSGDLGRESDPITKVPTKLSNADYLLIESTYGDRLHEKIDPTEIIKNAIIKTAARGGVVVIPAFAVGRAQNIMYYIEQLKEQKAIPEIPVFLDSPMAIEASKILQKNQSEHKLGKELCQKVCDVARYTASVEESKALNEIKMPMIIISASGMAEGGRVLHHLKNYISNHRNTILFTGFQAQGTRGDKIVSGYKTIKIHGQIFEINAEIINLTCGSAHADYEEILSWLSNFKKAPKKVFITHGSLKSATSLQEKIKEKFGWNAIIPKYLQSENLK
jgi:metallo-beta-lactamase family protein